MIPPSQEVLKEENTASYILPRVFVINLDKDIDRMKFANKQASDRDIPIERIAGVLARDLSKKELHDSVNRFRWYCATGSSPLIGEIGCCLSHQKIYKRMIDENIPVACILEDDVFLLEGFKEKLIKLKLWIDVNQPIVVRLNYSGDGRNEDEGKTEPGIVRVYSGTAACSYVLTKTAAKVLLKENSPMITASDAWGRWAKIGIIKLYNCDKKVCWHNNAVSGFNSTISSLSYKSTSLLHRFSRKAFRIFGKAIDYILIKITH